MNKFDITISSFQNILILLGVGLFTFISAFTTINKVKILSYLGKKFNMLGNFFSFYVAVLLIIQMPIFYSHSHKPIDIVMANFDFSFFSNVGAALFCFTNQFAIISVCKILKKTSQLGFYTVLIKRLL